MMDTDFYISLLTTIMEARVAELENKVKQLMMQVGVDMPEKKKNSKKSPTPKETTDEESKKKKSATGYLLYANDIRASVKQSLIDAGTENPKPTDVIKEVAKLWKALPDEDRDKWNTKAKTTTETTE